MNTGGLCGAPDAEVMLGEGLAKSLKAQPGSSLTLLAPARPKVP